jgi:histidine triad (HIT) family protein
LADCIFCRIVRREIESSTIYEDDKVLAFLDIMPRNPGHTLVIPKAHRENIFEITEDEIGHLYKIVKKVAHAVKKAVNAEGISIVQSNKVTQGVMHFHTHVVPRYFSDGMPIVWEGDEESDKEELDIIAKKIKNNL